MDRQNLIQIQKELQLSNISMFNERCKIADRDWFGYAIDVLIPGAHTTYRVHEFTKCMLRNVQKKNSRLKIE